MKQPGTKSGKMGDVVWQRNRYGQICDLGFSPANRRTPAQRAIRGVFAAVSLLAAVLVTGLSALSVLAASFQPLGDLPGGNFYSSAIGVSADGTVVVGTSHSANGNEAYRWTATNAMVGLGDLPGGAFYSYANGVSADGSVVVGRGTSASTGEAFRWTQATGMVSLGDLPGGDFYSDARGISADGRVIVGVGRSESSGTDNEGFRWTAATGMVGLGDLPGGRFWSEPYAVSGDGSVIVGWSDSAMGSEAFRWTQASGMLGLGDFPGGLTNSTAYAVSADGRVAAGRGYSGAFNDSTHEAFRWTAATGLVRLGFIPCNNWSIAHAVSADGSIIVGDPESSGDCAFIWDAQHGMRNLHTVLANDYGLNLTGWQLSSARGISLDGTFIVGNGINPSGQYEAWLANLRPPALACRREAANLLLLWPTNTPGWLLEQASGLGPSSLWVTNPAPIGLSGTNLVVTNALSAQQQFFRLRKP